SVFKPAGHAGCTLDATVAFYFFFSALPRPPRFTLFPYTTLFRSCVVFVALNRTRLGIALDRIDNADDGRIYRCAGAAIDSAIIRSEEHTSELQSRGHLVCRLLLEKKKPDQASEQSEPQSIHAGLL